MKKKTEDQKAREESAREIARLLAPSVRAAKARGRRFRKGARHNEWTSYNSL